MPIQLVPFVGKNSCVVVSLTFSYGRFKSELRGVCSFPMSRPISQP